MKVLRAHVDDELMTVELDIDASNVASNRIARLEQNHVVGSIEQPGQRHAGHPAADDANRTPTGSSAERVNRQRGACGERAQNLSTSEERRHGQRIRGSRATVNVEPTR